MFGQPRLAVRRGGPPVAIQMVGDQVPGVLQRQLRARHGGAEQVEGHGQRQIAGFALQVASRLNDVQMGADATRLM